MPVAKLPRLGVVAAVVAMSVGGWIILHPTGSGSDPTTSPTDSVYGSASAAPGAAPAAGAPDLVISASAPLRLRVPSIGIDGAISEYTQAMIDTRDGFDPPDLSTIAWDTTISGGLAGTDSTNTVYLYGHSWVDAAVFNSLQDLQPGAVASIDTANGRLCYVEQKSLKLGKSEYKNNDELTNAIPNRLVLVSCYRPTGYNPNAATVQNIVAVLQLNQSQTNVGC